MPISLKRTTKKGSRNVLDQELANYSPWVKSSLPFVHENLIGTQPQSFAHLLAMAAQCYNSRSEQLCSRQSQKYLLFGPLQKRCADPCSRLKQAQETWQSDAIPNPRLDLVLEAGKWQKGHYSVSWQWGVQTVYKSIISMSDLLMVKTIP